MRNFSYLLRIVPLVPISALAVFVAGQAGCSDTSGGGDGTDLDAGEDEEGCRDSEEKRTIQGTALCCAKTSNETSLRCFQEDAPRPGDACDDSGATRTSTAAAIETDTCVSEDCSGDTTSDLFNAETVLTTSTLTCRSKLGTTSWQVEGDVRVHTIDRVCDKAEERTCSTGYGYGYGGHRVTERDVTVFSSKCRVGDGAEADCPLD